MELVSSPFYDNDLCKPTCDSIQTVVENGIVIKCSQITIDLPWMILLIFNR